VPYPIITAFQDSNNVLRNNCRSFQWDPQEHDAATSGQAGTKSQFSKVFVKRKDKPVLLLGAFQKVFILCSRTNGMHPLNVMTVLPQCFHHV